ncbi:MAG TPA: hypothetical protein VNK92_05185 [Vicinamibacterales bacterium]|nr:hypothetical protein [Vicinamibacterales bacterium]
MRPLTTYLLIYFVLLVVALATLWATGVLGSLPVSWTLLAILVAFGLGVLAAITGTRELS